jgi:hypothetical protein
MASAGRIGLLCRLRVFLSRCRPRFTSTCILKLAKLFWDVEEGWYSAAQTFGDLWFKA